jgi:hypothetical protein
MVETSCTFVTTCSIQYLATLQNPSLIVSVITMQSVIITTVARRRACPGSSANHRVPLRTATWITELSTMIVCLLVAHNPTKFQANNFNVSLPFSWSQPPLPAIVHHRVRSTGAQFTIIVCPFDLEFTLVHWLIMICSQVTYTHIQPFCSDKYVSSSPNSTLLT